jgi:hypothetical protein
MVSIDLKNTNKNRNNGVAGGTTGTEPLSLSGGVIRGKCGGRYYRNRTLSPNPAFLKPCLLWRGGNVKQN